MNIESRIVSARGPKPVGPYPHARRVGDFLFVSGMGPRRPGTDEIPGATIGPDGHITDHNVAAETRAAIENIRVILEDAGSSLQQVVDVTVFLTDIKRDFEEFNSTYGEYFEKIQPTRTTVGVTALPTSISVEMKVIAYLAVAKPDERQLAGF